MSHIELIAPGHAKGRGGIEAKVIEMTRDCLHGHFLTTMQLRYPRFIHAEFMTHRVFSRNASSSRAIPVAKMLEQVRNDPAMPIHWGKNQPGMQAREELQGEERDLAITRWTNAANDTALLVEVMLEETGLHKQVLNRLLEPFQFIHVIVTATDWENFFDLRAHEAAQPEIHELALAMREAQTTSPWRNVDSYFMGTWMDVPNQDWHLPYVSDDERDTYNLPHLLAASAARCARVSYLNHDGSNPDIMKDAKLFTALVGMDPLHASPIEHQGYALKKMDERSGNFQGFMQFRQGYSPSHPSWQKFIAKYKN